MEANSALPGDRSRFPPWRADEFTAFQPLPPEAAVFLRINRLHFQQHKITKLRLQRGQIESFTPQFMEICLRNFSEHARIAPAVENRMIERERELKCFCGTLVNVEANQRS